MRDDFDKKLFEMAKNSKVKEPDSLKLKVNSTCKNLKKRRFNIKPVTSIAAVLAFCFLTLSICSPAYAANIPLLGGITEFISNRFNLNGYNTNSQELNYVVSNDDYTLTLESAYYDGIETTVFFTIKGNEKLDLNKQHYFEADLKYKDEISYEYSVEKGEFIDEYTFAGMMIFYIHPNNSNKLPEEFNIKLDIPNLVVGQEFSAINSKPLNLKFDINDLKIEEFEINKEISYDSNSIFFNNIKKYPTSLILDFDQKFNNTKSDLDFILCHETLGYLSTSSGKYFLPKAEGNIYIIPKTSSTSLSSAEVITETLTLSKGKSYDFKTLGNITITNIEHIEDSMYISIHRTGYTSVDYFRIIDKNNPNPYIPIIETEKKVLGLMDTITTYMMPNFNPNTEYAIEYKYHPKNDTKILTDQIIKFNPNNTTS